MYTQENQPPRKYGFLKRFVIRWIGGADLEKVGKLPQGEEDAIISKALINVGLWVLQSVLYTYISHRLFAEEGQFRLELVLMSIGLATYILIFDAVAINRAGYFEAGAEELCNAGMDLSGGWRAGVKNSFFYVARFILSIGLAQMTALFMLVMIFAKDIDTRIQQAYRSVNGHLVIAATKPVDDQIERAREAVATQKARVAELSSNVSQLQAGEIDPLAANPQVHAAQQEVADLMARKRKLEEALESREEFRNAELGGAAGQGHTGRAGNGPKHRAAMAQVEDTKTHLQETTRALEVARARLETLRKEQQGTALETVRQQAHNQLGVFDGRLREEKAKFAELDNKLTELSNNRGLAIRANLEKMPDYVRPDDGLLAQTRTLREIMEADPQVATVVYIIEIVALGLEMAVLLAKMCFIPSMYAREVTAEAFMDAVQTVEEVDAKINGNRVDLLEPTFVVPEPANDNLPANDRAVGQNPFGGFDDLPPSPPRRPRGRPRKHPPPEAA